MVEYLIAIIFNNKVDNKTESQAKDPSANE